MYPTIKINIHDTLLFFVTDQRYCVPESVKK